MSEATFSLAHILRRPSQGAGAAPLLILLHGIGSNEEDLMGLSRVGESDIHATPAETARRRIRWLLVTAFKTVVSSLVISQFEATIEQGLDE